MKRLNPWIMFFAAGALAVTAYFWSKPIVHLTPEHLAASLQSSDKKEESPKRQYGLVLDGLSMLRDTIELSESLGEILSRYNVSPQQINQLASFQEIFDVRKLRAHKPYTIIHLNDSLKTAKGFIYHPNPVDYVAIYFEDSVRVLRAQHPVDTLYHELTGRIESSLYQAVVDQGGSPQLVNELADVFAWMIDFFGLQTGDYYKVRYTTYAVEGVPAGLGEIQTALFHHMDKDIYAFSYDQGRGTEYFDEEGNSLRRSFLKAPLNFTRISSRFSYSRLHPILKIRRPHLGVDYAAPIGTPVVAVGDGVVTKASYSGVAGRLIKIQHNSNYATAYLHLHSYAKGLKAGTHVRQGQVIGYVGSSGLSTGPHLDFRFYKNGVPVDPLSVDPEPAEPLGQAHIDAFEQLKKQQKKALDKLTLPAPTLAVSSAE